MKRQRRIIQTTYSLLACVAASAGIAAVSSTQGDEPTVTITRIDPLVRLFPDLPAPASFSKTAHVPRGGSAPSAFAVTVSRDVEVTLSVTRIKRDDGVGLRTRPRVYNLVPVHVEGNTQGSMCSEPSGPLPEGWLEHLVREAPFDTHEVLVESESISLTAGETNALLVDIDVPRSAKPGSYAGALRVAGVGVTTACPFSLQIHATTLPEHHALHSVHWLSADPANLTSGTVPEWWSEEHWALLEHAGQLLRSFGDDTMFTPLIEDEHPLIPISRRADGSFTFDYSRFDRWMTTFKGQGYRLFAGRHLNHMGGRVKVWDEVSGDRQKLFDTDLGQEKWLAFLPIFLGEFHAHMAESGWVESFVQHQYDEPKDPDLYEALSSTVRESMPGVGSIDAINSRPAVFSPLVDHLVFNLVGIRANRELASDRAAEGKRNWLYHCTSPYPPYPNRHTDCPLAACRLWPWMCYTYDAQGFLFWAANLYRGVEDEYLASLGPMRPLNPGQSVEVGHPPGDDWLYYRGPDGLRPSVRILAHREGLTDHTLLAMIGAFDPDKADALQKRIVGDVVQKIKDHPPGWNWARYPEEVNYLKGTYSTDPADYHDARAEMLRTLDEIQ
jgi:glycosyl hydrolase family 123